ncbi:MAG: hypothetical protein JNL21_00275 [Myxococcales bacterium]|nr:hypothetical protein [Myxococcales bacterium]
MPGRRRSRPCFRLMRWVVAIAYLVVGVFVCQSAALDVLGGSDGPVVLRCADDVGSSGDDCDDCGSDCHSCLGCAHQAQPALAVSLDVAPVRLLSFCELPEPAASTVMRSVDRGPPLKVPKPLA